jgi:hypothetical protein
MPDSRGSPFLGPTQELLSAVEEDLSKEVAIVAHHSAVAKQRVLWILQGLALVLLLGAVRPAGTSAQPQPGDIGIFFDEAGTTCRGEFPPLEYDLEFWLLAFGTPDLVGIESGLQIDPALLIFDTEILPAGAINVGTAPTNWIVGVLEGCIPAASVLQIVRFTWGYYATGLTDALICITPPAPSSVSPPGPAFVSCDGSPTPFRPYPPSGAYPAGCAVVNPTVECGPLPDTYQFALPNKQVQPGAEVDASIVLLQTVSGPAEVAKSECPVAPFTVDEISFSFTWDPAVADYVTTTLANAAQDWELAATNPDPGRVDVQMTGPTPSGPPFWFLNVRLRMRPEGGVTPLLLENATVRFDGVDQPFETTVGQLTAPPVSTEAISFGAVKARY